MILLAIDPGRDKCGVAILRGKQVVFREVIERKNYLLSLAGLMADHKVEQIVLGDGTGSREFQAELNLNFPNVPVTVIDERHTTEEARARYWQENPPAGIKRLLPTSMQLPPIPYDHYVAVILGERFLTDRK